jgi:hypothetical protein
MQNRKPVRVFGRESNIIEYEIDPDQECTYIFYNGEHIATGSLETNPILEFCEWVEKNRVRQAEYEALQDLQIICSFGKRLYFGGMFSHD